MDDVNVPGEVTTGEKPGNERGELLKMEAKHADFFAKYGEPDGFHFFTKVQSDGAFAVRVIQDLLGYFKDTDAVPVVDKQAPQENNITGTLGHTGDVATKTHFDGESTAQPPATVEAPADAPVQQDDASKKSKK